MKKIHLQGIMLFLLTAIVFNSCISNCKHGRGELVKENREPGTFSGIRLKVPANLIIEQGSTPSFSIEAQENIQKIISTTLKEETLIIESSECIGDNKGINIYIQLPVFTKLVVEGSGEIHSKNSLTSDQLGLAVNGSGFISVKADAALLFCGIKGSGEVKISGTGKTQHVKVEGSGSFKGEDFHVFHSDASISGSGDATVAADSSLQANVNGSGSIRYVGNPKIDQRVNGSGSISRLK
ncbi:MAG: head GIN domain-containing protein [Bacteroidota bacterium]